MGSSSLLGSAIGLSVATIGAGVLALPAAFESAGVASVVGALAIIAFFTVASLDYLVLCIEKLDCNSYEDISDELLGQPFKYVARSILIVYNLGTAVGYIVVIGEIFAPLLPIVQPYVPFLSDPTHVTVLVWALVLLPLSCIPNMRSLHATGFLAIVATFVISGVIAFRYFLPLPRDREHGSIHFVVLSPKAFLTVPVVMFSFDCQSLVFQVYAGLRSPSRATMAAIAGMSVLITGSVYGLVGFFGYASNTPHVRDNVLANYNPLEDHLFAVGEACYSLTVMLAYALVLLPCRDAIYLLLFGYSQTHAVHRISFLTNVSVSGALSLTCLLLALLAPGFLYIVAVMGGLCSGTLCFTYPALFRLRLNSMGIAPYKKGEHFTMCVMLALGALGALVGLNAMVS